VIGDKSYSYILLLQVISFTFVYIFTVLNKSFKSLFGWCQGSEFPGSI
jgi:hypothetical protein